MPLKMGKSTREAFGLALAALGAERPDLVVLDADVNNSTRTEHFRKRFADRFFNVGIAESNLVGVAAGMAASGKTPVLASFAAFLWCNAFDQIRMCVGFPNLNVKLVGSHSGISIGQDGPSQMAIEDFALSGSVPGMAVLAHCDEPSAVAATRAMVEHTGPVYLRTGRPEAPVVYPDGCEFRIGRANRVRDGKDVTFAANGCMVALALAAADDLALRGIQARVLDFATIKPLDEGALLEAARQTRGLVVAEEHLAWGGLGSAVAMALGRLRPTPLRFVNVGDTYAESGPPEGLLTKYGLTKDALLAAALELAG